MRSVQDKAFEGPAKGLTEIFLYRRPKTTVLCSSASVSSATRFSFVALSMAFSTCAAQNPCFCALLQTLTPM